MSRKNRNARPIVKPQPTHVETLIASGPIMQASEITNAMAADGVDFGARAAPLGNLSEADRAAIMEAPLPDALAHIDAAPQTASEFLSTGGVPVAEGQPFNLTERGVAAAEQSLAASETSDDEGRFLEIAARLLTAEQKIADLERATEEIAKYIRVAGTRRETPRHVEPEAPFVAKPTPEEEAVYSETNLARGQQNEKPFDGIQAWRNAGSPALKAKPVVNPLQRGRAA